MKSTFRIAFYRGTRPGWPGVYNRAVRLRGRGPYSHVELIFSDGMAASSSFADGGVRFKRIEFDPAKWDFIDLPAAWEPCARAWFEDRAGADGKPGMGYDVMGNVFLAVGFISHSIDKVFCSEAAGGALGIDQGFRLEPNTLHPIVKRMVEVHYAALCEGMGEMQRCLA